MTKPLTLGSLFDGSGAFPLAAKRAGITPIWASEVEPFAIRVTTKRLSDVKHVGDIQKLDGTTLPPVDIITFGSPCQDLSIAGKRSGIQGSRSSLFYEAIRIIKEMRSHTNGLFPRYAIWENVPGAFSSNKGEDFQAVLEAFADIKGYTLPQTRPKKWHTAGEILGDNFSLAWRVLDAQYFGVPQRRKRIFLVADFTGTSASQILFEPTGIKRNLAKGKSQKQDASRTPQNSTDTPSTLILNDQGGQCMNVSIDVVGTLRAQSNHPPLLFENHAQDGRVKGPLDKATTLTQRLGTGGNNQPLVTEPSAKSEVSIPLAYSLAAKKHKALLISEDAKGQASVSRTLDTKGSDPCCNQGGMAVVSFGLDYASMNQGKNARYAPTILEETQPTLVAKGPGAVATSADNHYKVRRLTPLECARLQGFPDNWCDELADENPTDAEFAFWRDVFDTYATLSESKKPKTDKQIRTWLKNPYSDTAAYKLWGNGIALPCAIYVLERLVKNNS
ncbi:DNA (cytosine-5-)-methyltransferase [Alloscardovia omnicolens]|uniref:DNA (cytosine-5-)-methyltransferase n=1 Tax=Alloscardovia omnicolens TaxID=419015 RepID=UPI003A75F765